MNSLKLYTSILLYFITHLTCAESMFVDVEQESNLIMRSQHNLKKIVNALNKNEVVIVVDSSITKFNNEEYILVRKVLFPLQRCILNSAMYETGSGDVVRSFTKIRTNDEFKEYKKKNSIGNCPFININGKKRRVADHEGSQGKLSEIIGYVNVKHLKTLDRPVSFGGKYKKIISEKGYRLVEPIDFYLYFTEVEKNKKVIKTHMIDHGDAYIPVFKKDFSIVKYDKVNSWDSRKDFYRFPSVQKVVSSGEFIVHLVKESNKGVQSTFASISSNGNFKILRKFKASRQIYSFFHLVPEKYNFVLDKKYIQLNLPLPFATYSLHTKEKDMDFKRESSVSRNEYKKLYVDYLKSYEKIDYALAIFSYYVGWRGDSDPYPTEGTMHCRELMIKRKGSDEMLSTGSNNIFEKTHLASRSRVKCSDI